MSTTNPSKSKSLNISENNEAEISAELLIKRCLAGDEDGWQEFFDRYGRLIYATAIRFGFSASESDEIFQEVSLEIVNGLATVQKPDSLPSWLITVTRRTCIRRFKQQKQPTIPLDEYEFSDFATIDEDVIERVDRTEERILLYRAMEQLGDKCQKLLTEIFFSSESVSYAEVSAKLDMPIGSIGPTQKRCIDQLRKEVLAMQYEIENTHK